MFKDLEELCTIYNDKINFRENLQAAQEQSDLEADERDQIIAMVLDQSPAKEIPKDFLEESISLVERSSLKLLPVVKEVRRRLVGSLMPPPNNNVTMPKEAKNKADSKDKEGTESPKEDDLAVKPQSATEEEVTADDADEEEKPDMRAVLGFLNQNEWIYNLNIGNIMQIQPLSMKDFLQVQRDEAELGRDSFLEKLSIQAVSYFCMSTEMRFLL